MCELKFSSYPPSFPIPRATKTHSRPRPANPPLEEEEGEPLLASSDLLGQGSRPAEQGAEHARVVRPRIGPRQVVGREGVAQLGQVQKIQRRIGRRPGAPEQPCGWPRERAGGARPFP